MNGPKARNCNPQRIANLDEINALTPKIIGCAIGVHTRIGPGLLEGSYESALCLECDAQAVQNQRPAAIAIFYREKLIGEHRIDLL
jgi:GxxExxY protein